MKKLIYILTFVACLLSVGTANAIHHVDMSYFGEVSGVACPPLIGNTNRGVGGVSMYTHPSDNGLCYCIDLAAQLLTGDTVYNNRGYGPASYLNAGVTRTYYDHNLDRLVTAAQDDIPFHYLAGRYYIDCAAACTNYCLYSQDFTNAAWTKSNCGITLYGTAPDGTETAMFLRENGLAGNHHLRQSILNAVFADNEMVTWSIFGKADSRSWILLRGRLKDANSADAYFDLENGVVGTTSGVSFAKISGSVDGFYRCSLSAMIGSGVADSRITVYIGEADNDITYVGNANSGLTIWGGEITETAWLAPYFQTQGSAALYPTSAGAHTYACPQGIFAESLGAEIAAGTLTSGLLYKITATQVNHFYVGCAVGEYFESDGTETCDANNKVKQVTNARTSRLSDGLQSPHWTAIFYAVPTVDADDMTTYGGLWTFDNSSTTGFYISSTGRFALGDGTSTAYADAASGVSAWRAFKVVGQVYTDSNEYYMRIGVDRGDGNGLVWGTAVNHDGSFLEAGTVFGAFYEGTDRVFLTPPVIWNRILSDTEIYWMGGSP